MRQTESSVVLCFDGDHCYGGGGGGQSGTNQEPVVSHAEQDLPSGRRWGGPLSGAASKARPRAPETPGCHRPQEAAFQAPRVLGKETAFSTTWPHEPSHRWHVTGSEAFPRPTRWLRPDVTPRGPPPGTPEGRRRARGSRCPGLTRLPALAPTFLLPPVFTPSETTMPASRGGGEGPGKGTENEGRLCLLSPQAPQTTAPASPGAAAASSGPASLGPCSDSPPLSPAPVASALSQLDAPCWRLRPLVKCCPSWNLEPCHPQP